jgi:hypothetical protein
LGVTVEALNATAARARRSHCFPKQQEPTMARNPQDDRSYDEARKLAEDALDAYAKGNPQQGDELAQQAKETNPEAVQEVVDELEEDKDSDHDSFTAKEDQPKD